MSPREIELLVGRYLDGAMTPSEEEEFFVRVALDAELRRSYQAQRIVESALQKKRQHAPRPAPGARERVAAMAAADVAEPTHTHAGAASSRWRRDLFIALATVAVGAALWLAWNAASPTPAPTAIERDTATAAQPATTISPEAHDDTLRPAIPEAVTGAASEPRDTIERRAVERSENHAIVSPTAASATTEASIDAPASQPATEASRADTAQTRAPADARVDSVRLDVRVKMP